MPDIVELVAVDHARIRGLFAELEDARQAAAARLGAIWAELAGLLEAHVAAAKEIFFVRLLGDAVPDEITPDLDDIAETVAEARLQPVGSAAWWRAVDAARAAATGHIDAMTSGPLPELRHRIPPERREVLGCQWQEFRTARALDEADAQDMNLFRRSKRDRMPDSGD
jgi:Hemerythrin HHE cation binding domain